MRRTLVWLMTVAIIAAACATTTSDPSTTIPPGTQPSEPPPTTLAPMTAELARFDAPRATATDVSDAEVADLVAGNTAFALELFRAAADNENTILSPYSIAAALTMTYAGARGLTQEEMRAVLQLALDDERIHTARNELDLRVTAESPAIDDLEPLQLEIANSIWGQQEYAFLDAFLEILAVDYDAGLRLVEFATQPEPARQEINAWVEEQTNERIVDLIPEGVINTLTRLVLVNAIFFKANWLHQFDPANTADGEFTTLAGNTVTVPLMRQNGRLPYYAGDGFAATRLPYAGDASMVILAPEPGSFVDFVASLDASTLDEVRSGLFDHQLDLAMPSFEFKTDLSLKPLLDAMGMPSAFRDPTLPDGADFTGITEPKELLIQDVVHQAFIALDEFGTEAAAATAVIIGLESAPPPASLTLDHPFLFFIQHDSTGEILFMGQVTDPSA